MRSPSSRIRRMFAEVSGVTIGLMALWAIVVSCVSYGDASSDANADGSTGADAFADGGGGERDGVAEVSADGEASTNATFCSSAKNDFCDDFEGTRTLQGVPPHQWSGFSESSTVTASLEAGTLLIDMRTADAAAMEAVNGGLSLDRPRSLPMGGGRRRIHIQFRALVETCDVGEVVLAEVGLVEKTSAL